MMTQAVITGRRPHRSGRTPRRMPQGRVCAVSHCTTRLSVYNPRETCHVHSPVRYPRVRGVPGEAPETG